MPRCGPRGVRTWKLGELPGGLLALAAFGWTLVRS
jgi:hypothetical protein